MQLVLHEQGRGVIYAPPGNSFQRILVWFEDLSTNFGVVVLAKVNECFNENATFMADTTELRDWEKHRKMLDYCF